MPLKKVISVVWDYLVLSFGTLIYCLSWDSFLIPNGVASGGLTGACTILEFATGIPVSLSFIICNAFLLLMGFLIMGKGFGFKTIYVIGLSTVLFDVLPNYPIIEAVAGNPLYISERVLIPIIGGLVEALGICIIFMRGGSTGGTDIIALIINKFWPVSPGKVFLIIDVFILATILLVPGKGFQDMVYGYMAMITFSMAVDWMLLGSKSTMQVLVFSEKYDKIADYIIHVMDRGVTALNATGWYTKQDRRVLLILVRKNQIRELTKAIKNIDTKAFVSVSPAAGVYGEGFEEMKTGIEKKKKLNNQ